MSERSAEPRRSLWQNPKQAKTNPQNSIPRKHGDVVGHLPPGIAKQGNHEAILSCSDTGNKSGDHPRSVSILADSTRQPAKGEWAPIRIQNLTLFSNSSNFIGRDSSLPAYIVHPSRPAFRRIFFLLRIEYRRDAPHHFHHAALSIVVAPPKSHHTATTQTSRLTSLCIRLEHP